MADALPANLLVDYRQGDEGVESISRQRHIALGQNAECRLLDQAIKFRQLQERILQYVGGFRGPRMTVGAVTGIQSPWEKCIPRWSWLSVIHSLRNLNQVACAAWPLL